MSVVKTCIFDADDNLINIGEWDDMKGENPLPDGAYAEEREVVYSEEYGWRLADAPLPKTELEILKESHLDLWDLVLFGSED